MEVVLRRRGLAGIAAVLFLGGCTMPAAQAPSPGGSAGTQGPTGAAANEWRFDAREHVSLWYHGLSFVLPPIDSLPLPIYDRGERDRALAAARRAGVNRTPLEAGADSIAHEFAGSSVYERLQFVPLYFEDTVALFNTIRAWDQADGNAQGAGSQQAAQAVQLLNGMFDTPRLRHWVAAFTRTLEAERNAYYGAWWREREVSLQTLAAAAAREWSALSPSVAPLLRAVQATGGQVLLTPSLAAEGRTEIAQGYVRSAVGPGASRQDVAYELVHELTYSLVSEAVRENVAPARLSDLGEDVLTSRAAARAGALVLDRLAPAQAEGYRRFYIRAAGRTGGGDAAFRAAFPLPPELETSLPGVLQRALAGS